MGKGFEIRLVMREIIPFSVCLGSFFIVARGALYFSRASAKAWHNFFFCSLLAAFVMVRLSTNDLLRNKARLN